MITADDSKNNKVNPLGLPGYKVPPFLQFDPWTVPEQSSVPERDREVEEDVFDDFEGENQMDDTEIVEVDRLSTDGWTFDLFNV